MDKILVDLSRYPEKFATMSVELPRYPDIIAMISVRLSRYPELCQLLIGPPYYPKILVEFGFESSCGHQYPDNTKVRSDYCHGSG